MGFCWLRGKDARARLAWRGCDSRRPSSLGFLDSMICTCNSCLQMFPLLIITFIRAVIRFLLFYFLIVLLVLYSIQITYSGNFCNIKLDLLYFYNLYIKCSKLNRVHTGNGFIFSQPSHSNIFGQIFLHCFLVDFSERTYVCKATSVIRKVSFRWLIHFQVLNNPVQLRLKC